MRDIILVFTGGGIGSLLRYFFGKFFSAVIPTFPIATLLANVSGSFILGIAFALFTNKTLGNNSWMFLAVGVCGGFSTFSTFTLDNLQMIQNGNYGSAILNIILNLSLCFISLLAGMYLAKYF